MSDPTPIKVFLASPSDVAGERESLHQAVREINSAFEKFGTHVTLLSWENSVRPGIGDYPQQVINAQIGDDYNVFVGVFWSRLGTPTPVAASGTLEEFWRAYNRKAAGERVEVWLYFKTTPLPYDHDQNQFRSLRDFRDQLPEEGVLYREFNNTEQLCSLFRIHLNTTLLESFAKGQVGRQATTPANSSTVGYIADLVSSLETISMTSKRNILVLKSLFAHLKASKEAIDKATSPKDIDGILRRDTREFKLTALMIRDDAEHLLEGHRRHHAAFVRVVEKGTSLKFDKAVEAINSSTKTAIKTLPLLIAFKNRTSGLRASHRSSDEKTNRKLSESLALFSACFSEYARSFELGIELSKQALAAAARLSNKE